MMATNTTEYYPFDGDYIEADYTALLNDVQVAAGYPLLKCREICVSLTDDDEIEILYSDDDGEEWEERSYHPVPPGWTIDQLRPMFDGYPVYLKTDSYVYEAEAEIDA